MYFCINEFEVGVNDSTFSGNEQQKVHFPSKDWKNQVKSSALYFRGISSSPTWCHSARLIVWYTHELLMSLKNINKFLLEYPHQQSGQAKTLYNIDQQ